MTGKASSSPDDSAPRVPPPKRGLPKKVTIKRRPTTGRFAAYRLQQSINNLRIRRRSSAIESFAPYDPALADQSVQMSQLLLDGRFWSMMNTVVSYVFLTVSDKCKRAGNKEENEAKQQARAQRLRETLINLGETYIKLGQFLSVRRDFLPVEIADELALLQDRVPPFDLAIVKETILKDLGAAPEDLFLHFEETPIASASVGQVHRARLKDGSEVVVKVQRPDLRQRFYQDLGCMRKVTQIGQRLFPKHADWKGWIDLSDEFGNNLFAEVNYIQEGRNADRLRKILRDFNDVRIPRVFWKYTGRRVLTLEYIPGVKVDKRELLVKRNVNLSRLAKQLVNCYLEQVLMHGFFHADPHAGNLAIDDEGRLVMYDFGMMGEISDEQRTAITGCISSVIKKDMDELVVHLAQLGIIKPGANTEPMTRALQPFIDYYAGKEIRHLDFTDLEHDIDQIALERSLCLPPSLAYLLRAGSTIEGLARTLQPNFSFVEAAKPALKKWIMSRPSQAVPLLRMIFSGNVTLLEDSLAKLGGFNDQSQATGSKKQSRNFPSSVAKSANLISDQPAKPDDSQSRKLAELKAQVNLLQATINKQKRKERSLLFMSGALVLADVLFTASTQITEIRPLLPYFLIGNGVMVAIIMWHLVLPVSLITRSDKPDFQGGNGD